MVRDTEDSCYGQAGPGLAWRERKKLATREAISVAALRLAAVIALQVFTDFQF